MKTETCLGLGRQAVRPNGPERVVYINQKKKARAAHHRRQLGAAQLGRFPRPTDDFWGPIRRVSLLFLLRAACARRRRRPRWLGGGFASLD